MKMIRLLTSNLLVFFMILLASSIEGQSLKVGEEVNEYHGPEALYILELDESHHDVYWVDYFDATQLFKTHWEDRLLWKGQLPPWLKRGVIYGLQQDPFFESHTGIFDGIFEGRSDGHWEWQDGKPRAVSGDLKDARPKSYIFEVITNWSADDQLSLYSDIYVSNPSHYDFPLMAHFMGDYSSAVEEAVEDSDVDRILDTIVGEAND
jgi:hypothetical protein